VNYETLAFIGATIFIVLLFDICTAIANGPNSTISTQIRILNARFPLVAFLFGVLVDHLLFQDF
jgi:hypothetical protein